MKYISNGLIFGNILSVPLFVWFSSDWAQLKKSE
jgi:hypothetical protein